MTARALKSCLLLVCALALGLSSCGYTATRILPSQYRTIYVEPFVNAIPITQESSERGYITNYPEIEEKATQGVINRFLVDGNLRVINKAEEADLRLTGKLLDFYRQSIRRKDDNTVEEYRLNLSASITLRDKQGKLLLEEPMLVGDTTYFLSGPTVKSEARAVDDLITDFSQRIVEWVIEYW